MWHRGRLDGRMVKATLTTSADWAKLAPRPRDTGSTVTANDLKRLFGGIKKNPPRKLAGCVKEVEPTGNVTGDTVKLVMWGLYM